MRQWMQETILTRVHFSLKLLSLRATNSHGSARSAIVGPTTWSSDMTRRSTQISSWIFTSIPAQRSVRQAPLEIFRLAFMMVRTKLDRRQSQPAQPTDGHTL